MCYLLSKQGGARNPNVSLADISVLLHHCVERTVLRADSLAWADGETGGKKVWADGSRCLEYPNANYLSGLLDLEETVLCSEKCLVCLGGPWSA